MFILRQFIKFVIALLIYDFLIECDICIFMKESLIRHIRGVFKAISIETEFDVYECNSDNLPMWAGQLVHSNQYFICTPFTDKIEKLKSFIGKEISILGDMMYWYDGDIIKPHTSVELVDSISPLITLPQNNDSLKNCTRLPSWLDNYIFNNLSAQYSPDYEKFSNNLTLSGTDVLKYLGTYFPRSYAEAFCIFDNLFKNKGFEILFNVELPINIAVIGCGTGGDLIGLLTVIEKYSSIKRKINIVVLDGNNEALNLVEKIIERFKQYYVIDLTLKTDNYIFNNIASFDSNRIGEKGSFDFIMSAKMIGEVIAAGNGLNDNAYYEYVMKFLPLLNKRGVFYLLDVTTRQKSSTFNPFLMNKQVRSAMKEMPSYQIVSPRPCSIFNTSCNWDCFCQKTFTVSHSFASNDKSKVAYKLIASNELAEIIGIPPIGLGKYKIHGEKLCPNTEMWDGSYYDAYYISEKTNFVYSKNGNNNQNPSNEAINKVWDCENDKFPIINEQKIRPKIIDVPGEDLKEAQVESDSQTDELNCYTGCYVIDTNVFLDKPNIIQLIDSNYFIVLSTKVLDELDHLKVKKNMSLARKKRVIKALKYISESLSDPEKDIVMEDSDTKLLPKDFDRNCPDNKILSVALKFIDENPILLTSDYGLQARAKGLGINSISLNNFTKSLINNI